MAFSTFLIYFVTFSLLKFTFSWFQDQHIKQYMFPLLLVQFLSNFTYSKKTALLPKLNLWFWIFRILCHGLRKYIYLHLFIFEFMCVYTHTINTLNIIHIRDHVVFTFKSPETFDEYQNAFMVLDLLFRLIYKSNLLWF